MRAERKPKPLAACSVCRALSNARENLNQRCNATVHGRRCAGIYKSALAYLWDPCESCDATGRVGSRTCEACSGFGWHIYG
jgi:hypothetical protein